MITNQWGLLGVEKLGSRRRNRTLDLGAAVRCFNSLAVPGLGGIWFCKPLLWACLGIKVARRTGKNNIQVANAIEALACWLALKSNGWSAEPRLRGREKMRGRDNLNFKKVSNTKAFYVSVTMRQQTGEPLRALGLVKSTGSRFNSYFLTKIGEEFLNQATKDHRPYNKSVEDFLIGWVQGFSIDSTRIVKTQLTPALSPLSPLSKEALDIIKNKVDLGFGEGEKAVRMRTARAWVDELKNSTRDNRKIDWHHRPSQLSEAHWSDIIAGTKFFLARDEAIFLLDALEAELASRQQSCIALSESHDRLDDHVESLKKAATDFLEEQNDPTPNGIATTFCKECIAKDRATLLKNVIERDGRVLRLKDDHIVPGIAFDPGAVISDTIAERDGEEEMAPPETEEGPIWPDGISRRLPKFFWFNLDLTGQLDDWLAEETETEE